MTQPTRLFDFPRYQLATKPLDVMMTMPNYGNRVTYSTAQFVDEMDAVSRGLIAMGLQAEEKVALISHNNRCEWNVMDHAIMQAGAIDIPIYPTMTEEDYKYILNHSESKYCFVSSEELYNKVMAPVTSRVSQPGQPSKMPPNLMAASETVPITSTLKTSPKYNARNPRNTAAGLPP